MAIDSKLTPIILGKNAENPVLTLHIQDSSRLLRTDSVSQTTLNTLCGNVPEKIITCIEIAPRDFSRVMAHTSDIPELKARILGLLKGKTFSVR